MSKYQTPYLVRVVVLQSGERLPMLCARASGLPLFEPTLYALTELRAANRSSSTIQQALRGVMVLYLVLDRLGVNLDRSLNEGRLLDLGEVEEVVRQCRLPLQAFTSDGASDLAPHPSPATVVALEKARMRSSPAPLPAEVDPDTAAIRVRYIRDYLDWRATNRLLRGGHKQALYAEFRANAELVCRVLEERAPSSSSGRNSADDREGLSPKALARLIEVIDTESPDNPWSGDHARERNALIVKLLLALGIRRGELLGIRVSDVNFQTNEVLIARRADDPADPRKSQPNTKTNDRLLALDEDLALSTHRYVMGRRRAINGARRHDFLIIANGTGNPLTLVALNKVFVALRQKRPDLPRELTPHVLRHTWNDLFSEEMDKNKVSEETENKMRSRLMGWSETSKTASTYTKRHVRRKSHEASLRLQNNLKKRGPNDT